MPSNRNIRMLDLDVNWPQAYSTGYFPLIRTKDVMSLSETNHVCCGRDGKLEEEGEEGEEGDGWMDG